MGITRLGRVARVAEAGSRSLLEDTEERQSSLGGFCCGKTAPAWQCSAPNIEAG